MATFSRVAWRAAADGVAKGLAALAAAGGMAWVLALSGCARWVQTDSAALLAQLDPVMRLAKPGSPVRLKLTSQEIKSGDTVDVTVEPSKPGYLYLIQLGTDGHSMSLLFPNAVDGTNYLAAGATQLPRPSWQLKAKGPAGVGYLLAVLADQPQDMLKLQADLASHHPQFVGSYSASVANYLEVGPSPSPSSLPSP